MLQEKELLLSDPTSPYGNIDVYFGCRNSNEDFIYKTEIQRLQSSGVVSGFFGAFSREDVISI
jgi:sulfite reductase alpha subunit-like flavoprotein